MEIKELSLAALIRACNEETGKFVGHASSRDEFCFELFRRAIDAQDQAAWVAIVTQYRGLVLAWVRVHPTTRTLSEDDDYWVNRTFERFWMAVQPERLVAFPGVAALLQYLKLCTHSVLLDEVRTRRVTQFQSLSEKEEGGATIPDIAIEMIDRLSAGELWQAIRDEAQTEAEERIAYLCLVLGMKPREIYQRYPEHFSTVNDVYRIKRNLFDRLERSPIIRDFLG